MQYIAALCLLWEEIPLAQGGFKGNTIIPTIYQKVCCPIILVEIHSSKEYL